MISRFIIVSLAAFAATIAVSSGDHTLTPRIVQEPGFSLIGIPVRTTNAREMSGQGVIGKQWARFLNDGLLNQIPRRVDSDIIALYTDYESDHHGAYTFILGAKVSSAETVPSGMVARKVPPGKYAVFTSEQGPVDKVIPQCWQRINSLPKTAPGGDRTYRADFELYGPRAADPQNAQVDVYVGIR